MAPLLIPLDFSSPGDDGRRQHERRRVRDGGRHLRGAFHRSNTSYGSTHHNPLADRISGLQTPRRSVGQQLRLLVQRLQRHKE